MSSLFPEIEDEIKELERKRKEKFDKWAKEQKVFKPSNGTESMRFYGVCLGCNKYNEEYSKCMIEDNFWSGEFQDEILETERNCVYKTH